MHRRFCRLGMGGQMGRLGRAGCRRGNRIKRSNTRLRRARSSGSGHVRVVRPAAEIRLRRTGRVGLQPGLPKVLRFGLPACALPAALTFSQPLLPQGLAAAQLFHFFLQARQLFGHLLLLHPRLEQHHHKSTEHQQQ